MPTTQIPHHVESEIQRFGVVGPRVAPSSVNRSLERRPTPLDHNNEPEF